MTSITLNGVCVDYPVFNAASRSFKNRVLNVATGGVIGRRGDGHVVVRSLDDVSFVLGDGARLGVVGGNGAGKTTLLRVLAGIYWPTSGHIQIDGSTVSLIDISLGIDPEATGRENIRLRSVLMGLSDEEIAAKTDEIIEFSGLSQYIDMPFRTYSSGMQLRLAFATSTAIRPEILIMDEWLATGDESFKDNANQRLKDLISSTKILILASHSRDLLLENCTRVIWLDHGRIRMDGDPKTVCEAYFGH